MKLQEKKAEFERMGGEVTIHSMQPRGYWLSARWTHRENTDAASLREKLFAMGDIFNLQMEYKITFQVIIIKASWFPED